MMNEASREKIPWGFCFTRTEVRTVPRRPKRPCSHPGCANLTDGRFCEEHQKEEKRVNERSAMQMTAVYSCIRILSEAFAGLPLHL